MLQSAAQVASAARFSTSFAVAPRGYNDPQVLDLLALPVQTYKY
jgi:hypothetical protein